MTTCESATTPVEKTTKRKHPSVLEAHDSISECSTDSNDKDTKSEIETGSRSDAEHDKNKGSKKAKLDYVELAAKLAEKLRGKDSVLTMTIPSEDTTSLVWRHIPWRTMDDEKRQMLSLCLVFLKHPPMQQKSEKQPWLSEYPDLRVTEALIYPDGDQDGDHDCANVDAFFRERTGKEINVEEIGKRFFKEITEEEAEERTLNANCAVISLQSWC